MLERFFKKFIKYPYLIITVTLLLTLFFGFQGGDKLFDTKNNLIINSSLEPLISQDSGSYDFFLKSKELFGSEDLIVIAIDQIGTERFSLDFFNRLEAFQEDLKKIRGVDRIDSILTAPKLGGQCVGNSYFYEENLGSACQNIIEKANFDLGCIESQNFVEEDIDELSLSLDMDYEDSQKDEGEIYTCTKEIASLTKENRETAVNKKLAKIIEEMKKDKFFLKDLISDSSDVISLSVKFKSDVKASDEDIQKAFEALIRSYETKDVKIYYGGQPRDEYESSKILKSDIKKILPLSFTIMAVILFLTFRTIRGVILPLTVVFIGIIWTFGLFAFFGGTLNLVTMILPPLLVAVASAYIIHVLNLYNYEASKSENKKEIIEKTIDHISIPMAVTAFTTIAGFLALTLSPIPAIKEMGLYACFGIFSVVFLSLTFVPATLEILPILKTTKTKETNFIEKFLDYKAGLVERYSKRFIYGWIFVVIFALLGTTNISFDSKSSFRKDLEISKDIKFIEKNLGGTSYLKVVLNGENLESKKTIFAIRDIQKFIENLKIENIRVDKIYTPVEYIEKDRNGLDNLKDKEVEIFFQDLKKNSGPIFLSEDKKYLQFYIRMTTKGTKGFIELKKTLEKKLKKEFPDLKSTITGSGVLTSESADNIAKGQIYSLVMALGIIFIVLSSLFLSFKMGFLAIYPNIAAIGVFFGFLGWLDIPIGVTVSIIGAIALGIGVDDTIHFLSHYSKDVQKTRDEKTSSLKTLKLIGKPMVYTTLTLIFGFILFGMSDMESQIMFGVLTAITLVICLIADLNFLPSIMAETKLITVWDYVGLKFDEAFIRSVSIFDGLTLKETKLATLMAFTHDLKKDEMLFKEGDGGHEMFIVLKGEMELFLDKAFHNESHHLATATKGKSFGEMALFRKVKRVATARAITDTQLLVLNEKVLIELQKRYPKIARKLFLNLAKDLENKIVETEKHIREKFTKTDLKKEIDKYQNIIEEKTPDESSTFGYDLICSFADKLQHRNKLAFG